MLNTEKPLSTKGTWGLICLECTMLLYYINETVKFIQSQ